ncbi:GyrI-like domain-containing protein [Streptomyces sp. RY43-2]|uniref:GyrI-like domain-containing protein n=1 Tax=Streptomyces macrolidinus TaxID=2952607 RepID=A0ABT0ZM96_9ACTN|nr:GyrI-like domain-containing protein [Streptomyces macrolidinus]MCN9244637.1 GyrI-like domain-containing protein [Streptomyces macrolidinus]
MPSTAKKIDYKRELKTLYSARKQPALIDVPPLDYLVIEGAGGPYCEEYRDAVAALFAVSYKAKFLARDLAGIDFGVMPLETLWHTEGETTGKGSWRWSAMIMQPEPVDKDILNRALEAVLAKKERPAAVDTAVYQRLDEGRAAQLLYVGPYDEEDPVIDGLHAFIEESGAKPDGVHHEIYLNSPDRTAPEKLKTVIRQPVQL